MSELLLREYITTSLREESLATKMQKAHASGEKGMKAFLQNRWGEALRDLTPDDLKLYIKQKIHGSESKEYREELMRSLRLEIETKEEEVRKSANDLKTASGEAHDKLKQQNELLRKELKALNMALEEARSLDGGLTDLDRMIVKVRIQLQPRIVNDPGSRIRRAGERAGMGNLDEIIKGLEEGSPELYQAILNEWSVRIDLDKDEIAYIKRQLADKIKAI